VVVVVVVDVLVVVVVVGVGAVSRTHWLYQMLSDPSGSIPGFHTPSSHDLDA